MRNEEQMLDLILSTARADDRIRAVVMNGSRTSPSAPRDIFQDYDIVYLVTEVEAFTADHTWVDRFGERIIMQMPEAMSDPPPENSGVFAYLMLFADGNRIDLTLWPVAMLGALGRDSQSILLLDKDGIIEPYPPASDADYLPQPPTAQAFGDCCNEFWWVSTYIAKGLWRQELNYAQEHFSIVRAALIKMLDWYVGGESGYAQGAGKLGKYLKRLLDPELWAMFERTFPDADYARSWEALAAMGDLFRRTATQVAAQTGHAYPHDDDRRVSAYMRHVRGLPAGAQDFGEIDGV
jgi:aminoglycoside 6-adenylyltransferase